MHHPLSSACPSRPSLFPPGSIWSISLWRAAWKYAFSLVLVFTVKKCVFIPNCFSSHCSYLCSLLGFPYSTVVLFLTSILMQASCAWEGCFASHSEHHWFLEHCWALPSFCPWHRSWSPARRTWSSLALWTCSWGTKGPGCLMLGLVICLMRFFLSFREFMIMVVAFSHSTLRVAQLFPSSEEKLQERIILSWDGRSGQLERKWPASGVKQSSPHFSYSLHFTACIEVLDWGKRTHSWTSSSFCPTNILPTWISPH